MLDIITRLERERNRRGWTQDYMARMVGVSFSTYNYWKQGKRNPNLQSYLRIEKFLKNFHPMIDTKGR